MNIGKAITVTIALLAIGAIAGMYYGYIKKGERQSSENKAINSFDECAAAGYPVMESYPARCKTTDGRTFTQTINEGEEDNGAPAPIPGVKSLAYLDEAYGFALYYPEGSDVKEKDFEGFLNATQGGKMAVAVFLDEKMFSGTNLSEAVLAVGISDEGEVLEKCEKSIDAQELASGTVDIDGEKFHVFERTGAAAGNLYELKIYRKNRGGTCYEIVRALHSGNIGNYPPGTVKEFDKKRFSQILDSIARTFRFGGSGSGIR